MSSFEEECNLCGCLKQADEFETKKRRIIEAVQGNDVDSLKTLLNAPEWYNIEDQDRFPLLHIAIIRNSQEVFDYLTTLPNYLMDAVNDDKSTALKMLLADDFMSHVEQEYENDHMRAYYAYKLIERGADVYQVFLGSTLLHNALERNLIEVAKLLIQKGVDINKQDSCGNTPLHICCIHCNNDNFVEEASMLLYHGADPMISNSKGLTAFDLIIKFSGRDSSSVEEVLINHIIGQYREYDINAEAFLKATDLNSLIFYDISKNTREVLFTDYLSSGYVSMLFTMKTHFLQIIIEDFDYVVKELLCSEYISFTFCEKPILVENLYLLLNSKLQSAFINWLSNVDMRGFIWNVLHYKISDLSTIQGIICFLLSYGMRIFERDLETVYRAFGNGELFKILLHMDVQKQLSNPIRDIMPYLFYNVTLDIPKMFVDNQIVLPAEFANDLNKLLPYYTIPPHLLRGCSRDCSKHQRTVPLLLELARNAFRRYLIERLGVTSAKQFYTFVKKLPISKYHKQLITLEVKLY